METPKTNNFSKELRKILYFLVAREIELEREGKITPKINQNLMKFEIISFARENLKFVDIQEIKTVDVMLNYN
jgi:phage/plasmid-associated DNA primase